MDQFHSLIRSEMAGMGLALIPHCLFRGDIASGVVSTPLEDCHQDDMEYYRCYPESRNHLKPLDSFRHWVMGAV